RHRGGAVVGARGVVVEVHVPRLPAIAVVDRDVAPGGAAIADPHHDPVGGGVHLGHLGGHQVVALVAVSGAGCAPAVGEFGDRVVLGEVELERLLGTGGKGQRNQDGREKQRSFQCQHGNSREGGDYDRWI